MKPATLPLPALATATLLLRGAIASLAVLALLVSDLPCMVESVAESVVSSEITVECVARLPVKAPRERRERSSVVPGPQRPRHSPADGLLAATRSAHPAPSGSPVPLRC